MDNTQKNLLLELSIVTIAILAVSRIIFCFRGVPWLSDYISTIVAVLFLYVPVMVLWMRRRSIDFLTCNLGDFLRSIKIFLITAIIVFPIFFLLAHLWQNIVMRESNFVLAGFPDVFSTILFQLLVVALPEEFFFRGYFQSAIDQVFVKKYRFLGADLGLGWLITAVVFAFAHSIITYQWWHFSIFFPALLFGYLRLRTGSIVAPILFHTSANIFMNWFSRCYF